ncbi:MAG TPA: flagellar hook-associated protein FlgL [Solirubrobacteraceae bacterium]|nr:flagellar hook-associated protein FlgL [Solirubrobacteraceae bacterium]
MSSDRIASVTVSQNVLRDITESFASVQRTGEELSSGKAIAQPSDNPFGAARAIELQSTLDGLSSYATNVQEALAWQSTATGSLTSIGQVVARAREIALQSGSGIDNKEELAMLGGSIEQLTEQVKADANAKYAGEYIFSGTKSTTAPYQTGAEDAYQGNGETVARSIAPGMSVGLGVNISELLGSGAPAADGKLLDVLRTIAKELKEGTPEALQAVRTSGLEGLERAEVKLDQMQSHMGVITDQLRAAEGSIEAMRTTTTAALAGTTEVNFARAATEYSTQQVAYEAAMRAGSSIIQMSLLNFLH